jgi:hypothetical protein
MADNGRRLPSRNVHSHEAFGEHAERVRSQSQSNYCLPFAGTGGEAGEGEGAGGGG